MNYIYARQSSGDEERSISVEQQISNCEQLAQKMNLNVEETFQDLNTSGRLYWSGAENLAQLDFVYQSWIAETKKKNQFRIGLGNLFQKLSERDIIFVDDITRLYRPLTNSFLESALVQFLLSKKVRIITVKNGEVNLNSFNDTLINALQNRINDNQLLIQRQKSMASFKRLKDSGEHLQAIPTTYGYKGTGRKYEYVVVPAEAKIVKLIYKMFLEGSSLLNIAREINSKHVAGTKTKTKHITIRTIKAILNRPLYCGYYYNSEGNLIKAKEIEGKELVSFEDWKSAVEILERRKTHKHPVKKNIYFYNGLCRCGYCNDVLSIVINNKKYFTLRCKSHQTNAKENCRVTIAQNTDHDNGLGMNSALEPLMVMGLLKRLHEQNNAVKIKEQIEQKSIQLNNIQNKEKQLSNLFLEGLLSEDALKTALRENSSKKGVIEQEIIQLKEQTNEINEDELRSLTSKVFNRKLTNEEYQSLINITIKEIKVFHNKIIIQTYFGDIELPRKRLNGWLKLPKYIWRNEPDNYKLYYYWGNFNIYNHQIKLLDLGYFKIFIQEEN